ncbi:hypothetical protein LTR28_006445, partial [Elasticomyces elasticus]
MEGSIFDTLDRLEPERSQYSDEYQDQQDGYLCQNYLSTPQRPVFNEQYSRADTQDIYDYEVPRNEYKEQQSLQLDTYAGSSLEETRGRVRLQNSNFHPDHVKSKPRASPQSLDLKHAPPVVQGIELVSTHNLPDRFRSVFPFPLFNAVQSKCFYSIYKTNDNLVLSSPTGSGKTAVFELAICRLVNNSLSDSFKIVYQAPTKSLCSERQRDWQAKFAPLGLQCAELTGDTDNNQLRNVQNASIIITTPEKWDSMTRKWKDHEKLMQLIKLFLIDEVHILKESRGATLEAVVSRMKSVGSDVRFVALSATVPNSQDIATWLGRNPITQEVPAIRERFGEEFRPVRLQKHVCGYQSQANDFAFDKTLDVKAVVERGFLQGEINVIRCTSTLAVGINLPCHMVIIKNTVTYTSNTASFNEYSDLEVMQMLGRAGRPQFDDSAVAVIMTRLHKVAHYEQMMSGQEVLESCLHKNLIEHLNAEIGLGTISDMYTAKKWLSGTFLYVRLRDNPDHYKLDGDAVGRNIEERLERICSNGLSSLI